MTEEEFIDSLAEAMAESEYHYYPGISDQPIAIHSRRKAIVRKIVNRVRMHTLTHMRWNLEAFAISQGYQPGEDSISFDMVFQYLDFEANKTINEIMEDSKSGSE